MKNMNIAKVLLVVVAVVLISIPLLMLFEKKADAVETKSTITSYDGDYIFFVVEDNKTPLAAAPHQSSANILPIIIVGFVSGLLIISAYTLWYINLKNIASNLIYVLPESLREEMINKTSFFHPVRLKSVCEEAAHNVANQYMNTTFYK